MTQVKPDKQHFCFIFITMLALLGSVRALPRTDRPLPPGDPFLFMWNAPTELCQIRYGIPLDLSYFQFVSSTLKSAINQTITIFYTDRFGIFPHVNERTGKMYNEGLPQLVDLEEHTELAEEDIERYIPVNQPGLAVLDFEEWRPLWIRNWGSKNIYRQISIDIIQKNNKSLSYNEARDLAKIAFERAARQYFVRSIRIGKRMRPNRLWGYYLFPECYNYEYKKKMDGFTGACPAIEKSRNDELMWLWKESTALFPSIYLELELKNSYQARLFVRNRMQEAMRVSKLPDRSYSIPIYPYIRPVFKDYTTNYMSEYDLVNTIGEAAALGAAGVVAWGDMNLTRTEDNCFDARRHLEQIMNRYIVNVTTATKLCSEVNCQGQGRCVRKHWNEDVYLHLDPMRYQILQKRRGGQLTVSGGLSQEDFNFFDRNFDCMCYSKHPCKSEMFNNVIHDNINLFFMRSRGADRPSSLLLVMILLGLKQFVM